MGAIEGRGAREPEVLSRRQVLVKDSQLVKTY